MHYAIPHEPDPDVDRYRRMLLSDTIVEDRLYDFVSDLTVRFGGDALSKEPRFHRLMGSTIHNGMALVPNEEVARTIGEFVCKEIDRSLYGTDGNPPELLTPPRPFRFFA